MFALLIILITNCNHRTSSKKQFSKACDIEIPDNVEVIKDEYQDMLQDFAINYEIKLTEKTLFDLTNSIRNSVFYNPETYMKDNFTQDMFIEFNNMRAVWTKCDKGYVFANDFGRDYFSVEVDTINMIAKFHEAHN